MKFPAVLSLLLAAAGAVAQPAGTAWPDESRAFSPAAQPAPGHRISAAQIRRVLDQRFPIRYPVRGLVDLQLQVPRLRFMPEQNRLGTELVIEASGPALRRPHSGRVDLDFALRYESSDQTVRAHRIRVNAAHLEGLSPDAATLLDAYVRASAEQSLREFVLHKLQPRDLLLADTMGLEPRAITVTSDGLLIGFVPKGSAR